MEKEKFLEKMGDRIRARREKLGLSQDKIAEKMGYKSKASIFKIEQGITDLPLSKIQELARILSTTPDYIMGLEDGREVKFSMSIPILGPIACGQPIEAVENLEWIDVDEKCDYGLIAKGDSMSGVGIYDGDLILLDKTEHLDNGEIGAVCVGEDVTLKKFYHYPEKNRIVLRATNPDYEDQIYIGDELKDIRIIGRMKRLTRKY